MPHKTNHFHLNVNVIHFYIAIHPFLVVDFGENFIFIAESPRSALRCLRKFNFFVFDFDYCLVIFLGNRWSEYFVIWKYNITFSYK